MPKHQPNALTLARLILTPVITWLYWTSVDPAVHADLAFLDQAKFEETVQFIANNLTLAAVLFVGAALTGLFDGMIARALDVHSKFGRIIDPIADKALVDLPLIVIAIVFWQSVHSVSLIVVLAVAVLVTSDVTMTLIHLIARDGAGSRVSLLAKWKTALELVVVGSHLLLIAVDHQLWAHHAVDDRGYLLGPSVWIWTGFLVIAAALSAYTGWRYLKPAKKS